MAIRRITFGHSLLLREKRLRVANLSKAALLLN
jgi:hypothetical protein